MPRKRVAEIYIAIGHNKHGKTELYRDLLRHMRSSDDRFQPAPGTPGLVMIVFTMPGYDDVFKVIRDTFPPPKHTTRRAIIDKYRLVFQHDRAGRLMDVQDFQHLEFHRSRFSDDVLDELLADAAGTVRLEGDSVIISHVYVERRVVPLDLFVREEPLPAATAAVVDFGQSIKDLASTNIFPGDLLPKNFGVTRHGRVVFYDYDELSALTDVNFRELPVPEDDTDEMLADPWFSVGERDVFPEEHRRFLGLSSGLHEAFLRHHSDLFTVAPWRAIQERIRAGELIEVFPYGQEARLPGTGKSRGW
jgi:isocitrate dehydrogenase kinase/phosphatase